MRYYSLPEVCALFRVNPATLRHWLRRYDIAPCVDASDRRFRFLTRDQLAQLAEKRHSVLIDDQLVEGCAGCAMLAKQVVVLARRLEEVEERLG